MSTRPGWEDNDEWDVIYAGYPYGKPGCDHEFVHDPINRVEPDYCIRCGAFKRLVDEALGGNE